VWLTILQEEVGEVARAALEGRPLDYHKEMVQVAAVAVAALESLERNPGPWPDVTGLQRELAKLCAALGEGGER
jgi:NTP pyrophosphatase (non-canonical NTP hydrolase)